MVVVVVVVVGQGRGVGRWYDFRERGRVDCMIAWIIIDGTHGRAWDKDGTDNPRCYS